MHRLLTSYGQLIRNRRYFPLWLGQLISNLGDTLHYIALVVWVYQHTGSSLVVAGTVFFENEFYQFKVCAPFTRASTAAAAPTISAPSIK
jgi:hypothetical protein